MQFNPKQEAEQIKGMYLLRIVMSLGLTPASVAWNAAVFNYMKKVTYNDPNNPYLQYCNEQGIEPMELVGQVMEYTKYPQYRRHLNPWAIRIKLYLLLIGIGTILWMLL